PADVIVAVFIDADRLADWEWTKWLPHGADHTSGSAQFVAVGHGQSQALARSLLAAAPADAPGLLSAGPADQHARPAILAVVDGASLLEGRPCPLRELLAGSATACGGIVLTDRLPALCTSILLVDGNGTASLRRVATGDQTHGILANGISEAAARQLARA